MSVQATTAVWDYSEATGPDLLVMLAIADAANADGRNAHPGLERLIHDCRKEKSAVLESIKRCIERKELERTSPGHRGQAATFEIILPRLEPFEERVRESRPIPDGERVRSRPLKVPVLPPKGSGPDRTPSHNHNQIGRENKSKGRTSREKQLRDWTRTGCQSASTFCDRKTKFCSRCTVERRRILDGEAA